MINHFKTYLVNRSAGFFEDSLFRIPVDDRFVPSPRSDDALLIDQTLFGSDPDASLVDYRFLQFLHVIGGSHLRSHVRRFDPRETYRDNDLPVPDETTFETSIVPARGLSITENPAHRPGFLRRTFSVLHDVRRNRPPSVFLNGDRLKPIATTPLSPNSCHVDRLALTLTATETGSWIVDYRARPGRSVYDIVHDVHDLPVSVLRTLFEKVQDRAPEYGEGYYTITDSLARFCMVLFALAVANEQRAGTIDPERKRIAESSEELPFNTEGTFYYGSHANESLRMNDLKNELRCSTGIRTRRQTVEFPVPQPGYLYLVWPVRFGIPARNRIIVDGLLNSAWDVSYLSDREEQYVVFRSGHTIRTDTPVRIEIP